jgi:hypothetical protein
LPEEYFRVPGSARIWSYWMSGKDPYPVDRSAGDAVVKVYPDIVTMAKQSRQFLIRAVRVLAGELGVRQFLDIGTGLPTMQNTHEVAQSVAPEAKIVYVDNDPVVLAHARALLVNTTPEGVTHYIDADCRDPERILAQAREVLDFDEPVAVMFMGVLGHVDEFKEMRSIVSRVMADVSPGSYLALWDSTNTSAGIVQGRKLLEKFNFQYELRSVAQLAACFGGLEMLDPGLVPITRWRPDPARIGETRPVDAFGGVARKP